MNIEEQKQLYNTFCFLANPLIDILERLKDTPYARQRSKYLLKQTIAEMEKQTGFHFNLYDVYGEVEQPDGTKIDTRDIHRITAIAYDEMVELLTRKPSDIPAILELHRKTKDQDLSQVDIQYKPMLK